MLPIPLRPCALEVRGGLGAKRQHAPNEAGKVLHRWAKGATVQLADVEQPGGLCAAEQQR
tara:strand:+ start:795 stop:974 length:180 start_codon:yes stop_codon:yes gene_type:complete